MTYGEKMRVCVRCVHRGPLRHPGYPLCLVDNQDTDTHVRSGVCPHNYFASPPEPARKRIEFSADEQELLKEIDAAASEDRGVGDTIHRYIEKIGGDKAAELFTKITGIECSCPQRREWLNRWWPYTRRSGSADGL